MTDRLQDAELRAILDAKGRGGEAPTLHNPNAIPLRRILTLAAALCRKPLAETRILDLGCQEGVYAIEIALAGASVVAVEARRAHVERANICVERAGVAGRVRILEGDARAVTPETDGRFDIVFLLGLLYHLDAGDALRTLRNIGRLCDDVLIIDTHVALAPKEETLLQGRVYAGTYVREHGVADAKEVKIARGQASLDNEFAFYFAKDSLVRLLIECGFPTVLEAHAPLDATKPADRVTLAALKRPLSMVKTYPWISGLSEEEIAEKAAPFLPPAPGGLRAQIARAANLALHPLGFTLMRR